MEDADLHLSNFSALNSKINQLEMLYFFNNCGKVIAQSNSKSAVRGDFRTV
jgi:hypothetical protein